MPKGDYHKLTQEQFLAKATAIHGGQYNYSQTIYTRGKALVVIVCPRHGAFEQIAQNHLYNKQGCPKCGFKKSGRHPPVDTASFIARAAKIHAQKYCYEESAYQNGTTKMKIICPIHGAFWQLPGQHLLGKGCAKCGMICRAQKNALTWVEQAGQRASILYFLKFFDNEEEFYKIGITFYSVAERYHSKSLRAGYQYEVLAIYKSSNAKAVYEWEQSIIETFASLRYLPKRRLGGETECFSSADEILAIFPL